MSSGGGNLKTLGIGGIVSGIFLLGLSGLEKVLIFVAVADKTIQMEAVRNFTPAYIWNITNWTFGMGLFLCLLGSALFAFTFLNMRERLN